MKFLLFSFITVFLSSSLIYGNGQDSVSPEIQKKLDTVQQAEERIKQQTPYHSPQQQTPASKGASTKEIPSNVEEQILEKVDKEPPKQPIITTPANPCDALSEEEQGFANSLGPAHKKAFCSKFSPNLRKMAMNMVGKRDSKGVIITPTRAVVLLAAEHDIVIPFNEIDSLKDLSPSTPDQPQKESP